MTSRFKTEVQGLKLPPPLFLYFETDPQNHLLDCGLNITPEIRKYGIFSYPYFQPDVKFYRGITTRTETSGSILLKI